MLGVGSRSSWRFFAGGKHPCAKDYIQLGAETRLALSLNEWIVRGVKAQKVESRVAASPMVWRFWLRGGAPGEIVCGLLRDSSDSIGRTFPLLLLGGGGMRERPWQELPHCLSLLWQQMEELSVHGVGDVKTFEQRLSALPAPREDTCSGSDTEAGRKYGAEEASPDFAPLRLHDAEGFLFLHLRHGLQEAPAFEEEVAAVGRFLRERIAVPPVGAFIGGKDGWLRYGVLNRPLSNADFAALWEPLPREQLTQVVGTAHPTLQEELL